jgi:hypothetical protein
MGATETAATTRPWAWVARALRARRARAEYFAADEHLYLLWLRLEDAGGDGEERGRVLLTMAGELASRAEVYACAFGPHPIEWENGRDMAESSASTAELMWWLAAAEIELAERSAGTGYFSLDGIAVANGHPAPLPAARPVLEQLCQVRDLAERALLVEALYEAVAPAVGGQAAEVLVRAAEAYRVMSP